MLHEIEHETRKRLKDMIIHTQKAVQDEDFMLQISQIIESSTIHSHTHSLLDIHAQQFHLAHLQNR